MFPTLSIFIYYADSFLKVLGSTTQNCGKDILSTDRDLKPGAPRYKEGVIISQLQLLILKGGVTLKVA
jgi:hypothetical protein